MTDLIRQHIKAAVQYERDYDNRKEALLASYEGKGERIISGGQTGHDTWDVTDYRTGKVLFEGDGGLEGYARTIEKHGQNWVHIDPISEEMYYDSSPPVTEGLPESLCEKLNEWAEYADDDEIAMVLGGGLTPRA